MKLLQGFFYRPFYVFVLCCIFLLVNLVFDGTLFHVFRLNRDLRVVRNRVSHLERKTHFVKEKIRKSNDPGVIEEEARERLDFANEHDLIFIFPEDI